MLIYVRAHFVRGNDKNDWKCFKVVRKRMNKRRRGRKYE
jgi:hypothetical protein